jgi:sortase A
MRVVIARRSLKASLRWTQRAFLCVALLALGYCAFEVGDAWLFQHREAAHLDSILKTTQTAAAQSLPAAAEVSTASTTLPAIGPDGLIGRIEIPRLGVSVVVVEGIDTPVLRRAVGHIPGTAMPGQIGNVGIAAHRDTYFRPLRKIRRGDIVTLTTLRGDYRYSVVSTKIVKPEDVTVLDPDGNQILTLVTCYPFFFVGSAPNRFIVRAQRVV